MRFCPAANTASQLSHMLHYHYHHRHLSRLRIICFCLNREGGAAFNPSHEKWSRDHAHLCDVQHSPADAAAAAAPRISDEEIARHMNSLRPHIIIDLHGFMYGTAIAHLFSRHFVSVSCFCQHLVALLHDTYHLSAHFSYRVVCTRSFTLFRFSQARQPRQSVLAAASCISNSVQELGRLHGRTGSCVFAYRRRQRCYPPRPRVPLHRASSDAPALFLCPCIIPRTSLAVCCIPAVHGRVRRRSR